MKRRLFTFSSLALAVKAEARATGLDTLDPDLLQAAWTQSVADGMLVLSIRLGTQSRHQLSVLVARGSRPATEVQAFMAGAGEFELKAAPVEFSRREMMSRSGPLPRYQTLSAASPIELGEFRFSLPPDTGAKNSFRAKARLVTSQGSAMLSYATATEAPALA